MAHRTTSRKIVRASPQEIQRRKLVEEFARIDGEVNQFKPTLLRHEKLRHIILGWYENLAAEEEGLAGGEIHDIVISSRDQMRTVTDAGKLKLFKLWGTRGFIARANVLLKSLPDPKDELSLYTRKDLIGPRHLTVRLKQAAAASSAA